MADKTFTPGQRVKIISYPDEGVTGMTGTIRRTSLRGDWYLVDTDDVLPQEIWEFDDKPKYNLLVYPNEMEAI